METMTYEETVELEANMKIKNEADEICQTFKEHMRLDVKHYKGNGKFEVWSDRYNTIYIIVTDKDFIFECDFLHAKYSVTVTPACIFDKIKKKYRGIGHLRAHINKFVSIKEV